MKRLHTFDFGQRAQLELLRSTLENASIPIVVRNENLFTVAGGVPFTECYPEIWVVNDEDLPAAARILKAWQAPLDPRTTAWECDRCGEKIERQFDVCWNCGAERPAPHASA